VAATVGDDVSVVDIATHGGGFVALGLPWDHTGAVGSSGVWTSDTGLDWRLSATPFSGVDGGDASLDRVVDLGGRLVAVGHDGARLMAWSSADGTAWVRADDRSLGRAPKDRPGVRPGLVIDGLAVSTDQRLLVVAHAPRGTSAASRRVWLSSDGTDWERLTPTGLGHDAIIDVAAGPAGFLAVGRCTDVAAVTASLMASADGSDWRVVGALPAGADRVVWDAATGRYVAAGRLPIPGGLVSAAGWTSVDGIAWHLSVQTPGAGSIDLSLLVRGPTIVLATPGFDADMGWRWWSALVSTDAGDTWHGSAGWPVQGEVVCPALAAASADAFVLGGCGRPTIAVALTSKGP
jgi:hypothetical protein